MEISNKYCIEMLYMALRDYKSNKHPSPPVLLQNSVSEFKSHCHFISPHVLKWSEIVRLERPL